MTELSRYRICRSCKGLHDTVTGIAIPNSKNLLEYHNRALAKAESYLCVACTDFEAAKERIKRHK